MLDGFQLAQQPAKLAVGIGQWIAAAEYDLVDAVVGGNLLQGLLPLLPAQRVAGIVEMASEAVTAMDGAVRRGCEQYPATVLLQHAWRVVEALFLQRIVDQVGRREGFLAGRPDLSE